VSEIDLWAALLQQAARDYYGVVSCKEWTETRKVIQKNAQQWFESRSDDVGTFVWLANLLNHDPQWLRKKLLEDARPKTTQVNKLKRRAKPVAHRPQRYPWADPRLLFALGWLAGRRSMTPAVLFRPEFKLNPFKKILPLADKAPAVPIERANIDIQRQETA
jgi:hypothetical protein